MTEFGSPCTKALDAVNGARQKDYGHPLLNHTCTAQLMSSYLSRKYGRAIGLDAEDVCFFNILQKVSRGANDVTPDTLVDIAGYAENVAMVKDERARRSALASTHESVVVGHMNLTRNQEL